MKAYAVKVESAAEAEMAEAVAWYFEKSTAAADTFKTIVFDSIDIISHSPLSWGKVGGSNIRKFVLPRYPYSLYFEVVGDTVNVLAVAHNRRLPGYWQ